MLYRLQIIIGDQWWPVSGPMTGLDCDAAIDDWMDRFRCGESPFRVQPVADETRGQDDLLRGTVYTGK